MPQWFMAQLENGRLFHSFRELASHGNCENCWDFGGGEGVSAVLMAIAIYLNVREQRFVLRFPRLEKLNYNHLMSSIKTGSCLCQWWPFKRFEVRLKKRCNFWTAVMSITRLRLIIICSLCVYGPLLIHISSWWKNPEHIVLKSGAIHLVPSVATYDALFTSTLLAGGKFAPPIDAIAFSQVHCIRRQSQ